MAQVFVVVAAGNVIAFIIRDLGEPSLVGWVIQVILTFSTFSASSADMFRDHFSSIRAVPNYRSSLRRCGSKIPRICPTSGRFCWRSDLSKGCDNVNSDRWRHIDWFYSEHGVYCSVDSS